MDPDQKLVQNYAGVTPIRARVCAPRTPLREARACVPTGARQCTRAGPRARRDDHGRALVHLVIAARCAGPVVHLVCWSGSTPDHNLTGFVQRGFRVGGVPCESWKGKPPDLPCEVLGLT